MERFTERTSREETERANLDQPYDGACCLPPVEEQPWNAMTPEEIALQDAEELAIFGAIAVRREAARAVRYNESEVA